MANAHLNADPSLSLFALIFLQAQVNDWKLEGKSGLRDVGTIASHREIQELD